MSEQPRSTERRSGRDRRENTERRRVKLFGGEWPLEDEQRTGRDRRIGERRSIRRGLPSSEPPGPVSDSK